MIGLTRRYRFNASHRLHSDHLSEEANWQTYGRCNNPHGHGHEYVLEVMVEGGVDEVTGQVVDVAALDQLVRGAVLRDFDHRDLNQDVPELRGLVPTTEVVADAVLARLVKIWPGPIASHEKAPRLRGVRIYETRNNVFEAVLK